MLSKKMGNSILKYVCFFFLLALLAGLFTSCKPKEIIRTEVQYRDSLVFRLRTDSIFMEIKDSVFVYMSKDTMHIERFKTVYRDRIRQTQDTVIIYKDKKTFEKQIEKPKLWQRFMNKSGWMFWLLLSLATILIVVKRKF